MAKRYLDPKADLTFKRVFGEHPDLVTSLLNALLPFESKEEEIVNVEYLMPEMVPETPLRKNSIVDVRCRDGQGRQFIVEMQMVWSPEFMQRVMFNSAKAYVRQLDRNEDYHLLEPVYSLNIVNDIFEKDVPEYYHYYRMVHEMYSNKVIDGLHLVFVELPKFRPHTFTEKRMQALWLRYLTEIEENTTNIPQEFLDNPTINKALTVVEESAYTPEQLLGYDNFWDIIRTEKTYYNSAQRRGFTEGVEKGMAEGIEKGMQQGLKQGIEQGIEKGIQQGLEKGIEKEKVETLNRMKAAGATIDLMVIATGLSADEIKRLISI